MAWRRFEAPVDGGVLVGHVQGDGPRLLLVHGGPALSGDYLEGLAAELTDGYEVAWYQQRSLAPSVETGPFTVDQHVRDLTGVLDALDWPSAWLVGHSWGGHLVVAAATAVPDRLSGVLSVDPLGCVGDGGTAEFEQAMSDRTRPADRERAQELDERAMRGEGTPEDALESLRLVWPAYYADPSTAPPMPAVRISVDGYAATWTSVIDGLPALEASLPAVGIPVHFVHGSMSPIPVSASTDTAARIPRATVEVVDGAGHFIWHERPGAVRSALDRLTSSAQQA
jgi:pimeloyl-ACP methyl ester carboxylesterase